MLFFRKNMKNKFCPDLSCALCFTHLLNNNLFVSKSFIFLGKGLDPIIGNHDILAPQAPQFPLGHNHLLEIRLLKTGFLSRFQPNP
jgi:hypothetical protein